MNESHVIMDNSIDFAHIESPYEVVYKNYINEIPGGPHTHDALEIYYTLSSLPNVLVRDSIAPVEPDSIIIIPPYCVHQLYEDTDVCYERFIVTINIDWLNSIMLYGAGIPCYMQPGSNPIILKLNKSEKKSFETALNSQLEADKTSSFFSHSAFLNVLGALDSIVVAHSDNMVKEQSDSIRSLDRIDKIFLYINEHIHEPIQIDDIASYMHLNKDYMARIFKKATNATISQYIASQKTSLAQHMLAEGKSIRYVQEALGFSSYAYFYKFFKKMTGHGPKPRSHYEHY